MCPVWTTAWNVADRLQHGVDIDVKILNFLVLPLKCAAPRVILDSLWTGWTKIQHYLNQLRIDQIFYITK